GLSGPLTVPSWLRTTARLVAGNWKMPTAAVATLKVSGALSPAAWRTMAVAVPVGISKGSWALICPLETKNRGAGMPLIRTEAPASSVGRGTAEARAVDGAKLTPKIEIIEP